MASDVAMPSATSLQKSNPPTAPARPLPTKLPPTHPLVPAKAKMKKTSQNDFYQRYPPRIHKILFGATVVCVGRRSAPAWSPAAIDFAAHALKDFPN